MGGRKKLPGGYTVDQMVQFTKRFEPSGGPIINEDVCAMVKNFFLSDTGTPYLTVSVIHVPGLVHVPAEYITTEVIPRGRGTKGRGRPRATQLRCKNAKEAWIKFRAKRAKAARDTTKTPAPSKKRKISNANLTSRLERETNSLWGKPLSHKELAEKLGKSD